MKGTDDRLFHVTTAQTGQTVAAALRGWLGPETSWTTARDLVRGRRVTLNGNLCQDAGRRLKVGEVVKLLAHPTAAPPREDDVRIQFVDPHVVVVEKPSGITSVRHAEERNWSDKRRRWEPTLEDLLPRVLAKQNTRQSGRAARSTKRPPHGKPPHRAARPVPVRPVHRLDRDTSGLMVFARTVGAERILGQQFRAHTTHRRYLAIVVGDVAEQTIENRLVRDRGDGRRGSTTDPTAGKHAVTHVRPLQRLDGCTLVECRLETGRTHQIRIHLSELGHPVLGDKVYGASPPSGGSSRASSNSRSGGSSHPGGSAPRQRSRPPRAPRLALHAAELGFTHPVSGETLYFTMPLPADLQALVNRLK